MNKNKALSERLEQYGITSKGQITGNRGMGEVAGYAAAVGAGLAMAGTADASIIYSGVQNLMVSINPAAQATTNFFTNYASTSVDVDGGGADVFMGAGNLAAIGGTGTAKYLGIGYLGTTGGAAFLGTGSSASNLASGALIGPAANFNASTAGNFFGKLLFGGTTTSATAYGNFNLGTTGFVGIQLGSGNYGWIRLRVDDLGLNQPFTNLLAGSGFPPIDTGLNYPDKVTIIDWAFEDSGRPIRAGSVPEPTPLALLAAGATGIAAFRRRKSKALAKSR